MRTQQGQTIQVGWYLRADLVRRFAALLAREKARNHRLTQGQLAEELLEEALQRRAGKRQKAS